MNTAAMILCAGFGTRLGGLTANTPKPMLSVAGKPILEHTVRHLAKLGITDIFINLHFLPEQITNHFGSGKNFGLNITYSYETAPLGTAGAVKKIENNLSFFDNFLVLYGDIITNENFAQLINFHKEKNCTASIILHEREKSNSIVEIDGNSMVTRFVERPQNPAEPKKQNWVNSGLYCFKKEILKLIPENTVCDFPKDIFGILVEQKNLYGKPLTGYRCAIDSQARYLKACNDLKEPIQF
jgi:NDP-sugar pyrophosphorylase family protein